MSVTEILFTPLLKADSGRPLITHYDDATGSRIELSRATAAIRGRTLVVNLPGSPRAVRETFDVLAPVLRHAVTLAGGGIPGPAEHRAADRR